MDADFASSVSIVVAWETPPEPDEKWAAFMQKWRDDEPITRPEGDNPTEYPLNLGPVLIPNNRVASATAIRHKATHWYLHLQPRPTTPPPPSVQALTDRIGGAPGLRSLLFSGSPISASYRISVDLPQTHWRCLAIPRAPVQDDPCLQLDPEATVEQIGYRMTGPNGILEASIIYGHIRREFALSLFAKGVLAPRDDLSFAYAEDILDIGIRTFFQRESHAVST